MVSLLDEIESQVKERKLKKDKVSQMQNTQNLPSMKMTELSNSNVIVATEHRIGGIASSSVPHIRPVNTTAAVPAPLTPSSHQTGANPGFTFTNNQATKTQMVIVPKDKLTQSGAPKLPSQASQTQPSLSSSHAPPPKNTPISTTKSPTDTQQSKQLYIGAYTKLGGFQQRSSSNDGPNKGDPSHGGHTNPLVSPRKPQPDVYAYASNVVVGGDKVAKNGGKIVNGAGGIGNPTISGVNPARDFGLGLKKGETSVSSGVNKSSGTAISAGSKKPLNLFGLKFLSKGNGPTSGDRR